MMPNDDHEQDFQAQIFGGASWEDETDADDPQGDEAVIEGDEDDFEGHASGFG